METQKIIDFVRVLENDGKRSFCNSDVAVIAAAMIRSEATVKAAKIQGEAIVKAATVRRKGL
jgi:hypothetical protein